MRALPTAWLTRHRAPLMLSVRIVIAAMAAFTLGHLLGLQQTYWAVLTAIIVMQGTVGGAIKAIADRLIGSLAGAVWGVIVAIAVPHGDTLHLGLAMALAIAPLAVATAFNPAWRVAPVTAIILLLTPTSHTLGPVAAALNRMLEVGVGSLVAAAVALVLAPSRAAADLAHAAATALDAMAELVTAAMDRLTRERTPDALDSLHARIRAALAAAEAAAAEVHRERYVTLAGAFDPAPLSRTLRRTYHDLIMIHRATLEPLPAADALAPPAQAFAAATAELMRRVGAALTARRPPPSAEPEKAARAAFARAIATLRGAGATRGLAADEVARLFGLAFALEQLGANLDDLIERAGEWAKR
ncbi:MAG TPA: FUSC family protein [Caulobacteraceae bacterium]|jgi:uncharacterized membrane protein YccC|nr:FUSC family protein [Caulobacteraceae bacterium]